MDSEQAQVSRVSVVRCFKPGDDPHVKTSGDELTQGVVITCVGDLLIARWQHHIDAITQAHLAKYVLKRSGPSLMETQKILWHCLRALTF